VRERGKRNESDAKEYDHHHCWADIGHVRLGILDNSKWNANKLLRGASAALGAGTNFAAVNYYVKESFSKDAALELIEQIARENDIVLTAIGDCGSCCSCCILSRMIFKNRSLESFLPNRAMA
jgi:hypothetical protein